MRQFLAQRGYSEVYTYSFAKRGEGDIEVLNPVGKDRPFIRRDLSTGVETALAKNIYNASLLELEEVKIFEIGNFFFSSSEQQSVAIGVQINNKKQGVQIGDKLIKDVDDLTTLFDGKEIKKKLSGATNNFWKIVEFDFDALIKDLPEPVKYESLALTQEDIHYQTLSAYPFIVRDIAIFVPQEVTEEYIEALLKKEGGELVVRLSQFDKFQKPDETRISYGYRLVFQSFTKTLTDDEINGIMEHVTALCNAENNWQVR